MINFCEHCGVSLKSDISELRLEELRRQLEENGRTAFGDLSPEGVACCVKYFEEDDYLFYEEVDTIPGHSDRMCECQNHIILTIKKG